MICVSACLAGVNCKYDGGNNLVPSIVELVKKGEAILVCPEQLGGLTTPRNPSECLGERVISNAGQDVTEQFKKGAQEAFRMSQLYGCDRAILKSNSPSCGCHGRYDGTFSHKVINEDGLFAQLLKQNGVSCIDEKEWMSENE